MHGYFLSLFHRHVFQIGIAILPILTLAGCETTAERQRVSLEQDQQTCASFGTYAGPDHVHCMLVQQQRRDHHQTEMLERMRIMSETNRNRQETANSRRRRCEQDRRADDQDDQRRDRCS